MSRENLRRARQLHEERHRRPTLSRDRIVTAAIRLADREGADALSMRNLARELHVGAMTLYSYVQSRDELRDLVFDRIAEALLLTDQELDAGWREALATMARRSYRMFADHPWLIDEVGRPPSFTPVMIRHAEQTMAIVAQLTDDLKRGLQLVTTVDDYVFGHALRAVIDKHEAEIELDGMIHEYLDTGEYPHLSRYRDAHGVDIDDPDAFEHGLEVVLEGIDALASRPRRAARRRRGA